MEEPVHALLSTRDGQGAMGLGAEILLNTRPRRPDTSYSSVPLLPPRPKAAWAERVYFIFSPHSREGRSGQELKQRLWETLLAPHSSQLFNASQDPLPGVPPMMAWDLLHQSLNKTMLPQPCYP